MEQASHDKGAKERMWPTLVGAGVPRLKGWGKVVAVFSGAVNARHSQGLLVSLVEDPCDMTYLSLCVPDLFRKQEKHLLSGERVDFEGCCLVTEDFVFDLQGRPIWPGVLTLEHVQGLDASRVSILKETLVAKGKEGGFLGLLGREETSNPFVSRAREVLGKARKAMPKTAVINVLSGLVGLGPGSTPSGDDFLAGLLMGEEAKAVAENGEPVIPWSAENEGLRAALDRTNDAGKTLLWQALQGRFPSYLIETVRSVSGAKGKQEVEEAVGRCVGRGSTSGTDALVGFVYGLETHEWAGHR